MRWYADELFESGEPGLNPVEFALRSACVVVLPATANMLAAAALGLAASPAQTILLSAPSPVVFFPAMNLTMWQAPQVRRHLATLRGDGHIVVDPHEREVYQYWRRGIAVGLAPPPADHVRKVIQARLEAHG
jgi:phosphopantothenoylcysteine synthetase/decarboxylase